ncbi:LAQU0S13e02850g1_1 [Lachancea quebecensis]|uniref:LAQU0S13e02850g1_1 n=1 Tax=Lachancea quebecensis TaxID=1654605 RepID=A0A0P1KV76_9SACH|nr:LAQU0S13e02850g1_1 [Lachancea quebecensis]
MLSRCTQAIASFQRRGLGGCSRLTKRPLTFDRANSTSTKILSSDKALHSTRGKKLKPSKAQIVVLNPREAGLFKRKRAPAYFNGNEKPRERLSVLEGVEFDSGGTLRNRKHQTSGDILQEIESQRRKLLVFKSSVPNEQVIKSIHDLRPSEDTRIMSTKRYTQLKMLLEMAYTLPQLKAYARQYYDQCMPKSVTKKSIIPHILHKLWTCEVDASMSDAQDLVVERILDAKTRDIYLLLLTNNGKILQNFARLGATVAVALGENKIIVRATSSLVKYVEVSLRKILDNVQREVLPIQSVIDSHSASNSPPISPDDLVNLVQKETATYFEKLLEDDANSYVVSGFGAKRLAKAELLLLWALNYNPQKTERIWFLGESRDSEYKLFPFTDNQCLDWIDRNKEWFRLQKPVNKNQAPEKNTPLVLDEKTVDELYHNVLISQSSTTAKTSEGLETKTVSITLGQILKTLDGEGTTFQPKVPGITKKLLQLPLYDGIAAEDELYTVDQHEYYVQLKFIPNLSSAGHVKDIPPLELWFELDDYDKAISSSVRCLLHTEDKSLLLQTPQMPHDYKVSIDRTLEATKPYEEDTQNWLKDQPGLKEFLLQARLTFQGNEKLYVPKNLEMNLRVGDTGSIQPVTFDYVNVKYRRVLRLKYMDQYLVQFSDLNGGSSGGKYTQVDFICPESNMVSREAFGSFIRDVLEYV